MNDAAVTPPRYVPTLTEVVSPDGVVTPVPLPTVAVPESGSSPAPPLAQFVLPSDPPPPLDTGVEDEERLLRVLQRVEVLLDQRLAAAVAHAAESVTREFALRLREDIAPLVKEAVNEAMAQELNPGVHSSDEQAN